MPRIGIDSSLQRAGVHGQRVPGRDRRELNAEGEWIRLRLDFISRRGRAPVAAVNERGVPVAIRDLEVILHHVAPAESIRAKDCREILVIARGFRKSDRKQVPGSVAGFLEKQRASCLRLVARRAAALELVAAD